VTRSKFLYNLSRASYQKNWGKDYQPPTFGEQFLALLAGIIPKIGPLKVLQLRTPTPEAVRLFEASSNAFWIGRRMTWPLSLSFSQSLLRRVTMGESRDLWIMDLRAGEEVR
jgi:hypothetical protein